MHPPGPERILLPTEGGMRKSAFATIVMTVWLGACGSGGEGASDGDAPAPADTPGSTEGAREPVDLDVQFVDTPGGMTVEAISEREVQTFSCANASCAGMCDECAATACRASGGLAGACRDLVAQCKNSCTCPGSETGRGCGLPVCGVNLGGINVCMIGDDAVDGASTPVPDATPLDPAARPASAANPSSAARPAY